MALAPTTTFLSSPVHIRRCLLEALDNAERLDAAVAFVGRDWSDVLGTSSNPVRVVCWLSSTNTNPYAVEQMLLRGIKVRQISSMHAKVYAVGGAAPCCIVGSANLSGAVLCENDAPGQYEAAVVVRDRQTVRHITRGFADTWKKSKKITSEDLTAAKEAWTRAHSVRPQPIGPKARGVVAPPSTSILPPDWKVPQELSALADLVRDEDLVAFTARYQDVLGRVADRGRWGDVQELIQLVAEWAGHIGAFYPALEEPSGRIRTAFTTGSS